MVLGVNSVEKTMERKKCCSIAVSKCWKEKDTVFLAYSFK